MNTEKAIDILDDNFTTINTHGHYTDEEVEQARQMTREVLEQEPCEDAITRILKRMWNCRGKHTTSIDKVKMEQIIRDELPSVNPKEPKTGHWIKVTKALPLSDSCIECVRCSRCGTHWDNPFKYCPNCGAKMVELQERSEE